MMLGDLGADVIKIEAPRGDLQRPMAPYTREDQERSYGGSFSTYNRNKRGSVLDFNNREDREKFLALVETDDADQDEGVKPKGVTIPYTPSQKEIEEHELTHIPYRSWCAHCVRARTMED